MSTYRYSGRLRIRVTYVDPKAGDMHNGQYRCTVAVPGLKHYRVWVGAPAYLEHAVDSPEAFDGAAHAAISFADADDSSVGESASSTREGDGWHVGRSEREAYPSEV